MKAVFAFLLCLCSGGFCAQTPLRTERLWMFGTEYYRLNDWARANAMNVRWLTKRDVEVSSHSTRMTFSGDSRRMVLNGTVVFLSHPIAVKNGTAYISPADVNTAIAPVLWPPRNSAKKPVKHICIDAGHGGKDPGNRAGAQNEKQYTLLLAQELGQQLRSAGYTVSFTRTTDVFVDLSERPNIAERRGADLFISLHFNSTGSRDSSVRGAETYCMTPQRASSTNARGQGSNSGAFAGNLNDSRNMLLAYEIQRSIVRSTGSEDRGVKRARFIVLRNADMPSVLVEAGFMTNPAEARNIASAPWRKKLAQAIVTGIRNYRSAVER